MSRSLLPVLWMLTASAGVCSAAPPTASARQVQALVDPRVELLSIVFRLAGNPEYNRGGIVSYNAAVEARFGELRDHPVVVHARSLCATRGVSYDAVMSMAIHLDDTACPLVPFERADRLDVRWPRAECPQFVAELADFAEVGGFDEFVKSQAPLYRVCEQRAQQMLDDHARLQWFDSFFGPRATAEFMFRVGLLNGGNCYGPSVATDSDHEEFYCILGVWKVDVEGMPVFDAEMVDTVVHEYCHSYCNPLIDAHLREFDDAAAVVWPLVDTEMALQAYGDSHTMLIESMVRAASVRYVAAAGGHEMAREQVELQAQRGFPWVGAVADTLRTYEHERERYPTLDLFMPAVASAFSNFARPFAEEQAKRPRVSRLVPANGDTLVDPHLQAIVITFDSPMRDKTWAVVGGGENFPKIGLPSYDNQRLVLTIPAELQPNWEYEFWLNRGQYDAFQSEDGHKLRPLHVTFRTGP